MNVTKLKRRKRQMALTPGASDLYRNPYLKYDRKNSKSREDFGSNMRKEVKGVTTRTTDELRDTGLSEREKAFQFADKPNSDLKGETLKWREGATNWQINDNNPWVKNAKQSLKMPIVAGPSGTMTRMLQLWEWLSKPTAIEDRRLAVLAWMLNANDHTFHEMMLAAVDYGMPYRPGREAYMDRRAALGLGVASKCRQRRPLPPRNRLPASFRYRQDGLHHGRGRHRRRHRRIGGSRGQGCRRAQWSGRGCYPALYLVRLFDFEPDFTRWATSRSDDPESHQRKRRA